MKRAQRQNLPSIRTVMVIKRGKGKSLSYLFLYTYVMRSETIMTRWSDVRFHLTDDAGSKVSPTYFWPPLQWSQPVLAALSICDPCLATCTEEAKIAERMENDGSLARVELHLGHF